MGAEDEPLPEDIAEADAELHLAMFSMRLRNIDSGEEVVREATKFAVGGINIFRVMDENPEMTEEIVDVDVDITDSLIEKFDRVVDANE